MLKRIRFRSALMVMTLAVMVSLMMATAAPTVAGTRGPSLIRDAEIENIIRAYATPLFNAAGLDAASTQINLVNDRTLNAFVTTGNRMFINTGLLLRTDGPGQLIGVIAHETGHIAGGHIARAEEAMENASTEAIIAMLLGAAAGVASGRSDVGAAVMSGGMSAAQRGLMQYSRTQESAADQAALRILDSTRQSAQGLLDFMEILSNQELLTTGRQDPYMRTHPVTQERVGVLRHHVATSRWSGVATPPEFVEMHRRMQAKLFAFLEPPAQTLRRWPETDTSLPARYARAVAYYRVPDLPRALEAIDALIRERPNDPYFHELKGQILFENGRAREALAPYREAVRLLPGSGLLRVSLAQVQIETNDPSLLPEAEQNLEAAAQVERSAFIWRLLAVAYGRQDKMGLAALALAEQAALENRHGDAIQQANRALGLLPQGSPGWLRAEDIKQSSRIKRDKKR